MAAGLGFKTFVTGDVLTAADVNGYLMSQTVMVFASAAARTSAISSPQQGMVTFLKDTNVTQYYSGSAWVTIGGSSSASGLTLIQTQAFSGVSSQSLSSKFSSTYDNYRLYFNVTSSSTAGDFALRLRSGSTDLTGAVYNWKYTYYQVGSTDGTTQASADTKIFAGYTTSSSAGYIDILNPYLAQKTTVLASSLDLATPTGRTCYANVNNSNSYDGLTIFPSGGTITGTVSLYGFNN